MNWTSLRISSLLFVLFAITLSVSPSSAQTSSTSSTAPLDPGPPSSVPAPGAEEPTQKPKRFDPGDVVGPLGWLGWAVGLYAGYLQWRARRDQRKLEGPYKQLLEEAGLRRQAHVTETELEALEAKVDRYRHELRRDIPVEARRAFNEERSSELALLIDRLVGEYEETRRKLGEAADSSPVNPELRAAIQRDLSRWGRYGASSWPQVAVVLGLIAIALPTIFGGLGRVLEPVVDRLSLPFSQEDLVLYFTLLGVGFGVAAILPLPAFLSRARSWYSLAVVLVGGSLVGVTFLLVGEGSEVLSDITSAASIVCFSSAAYILRATTKRGRRHMTSTNTL